MNCAKKLLIICDPDGKVCMRALQNGYLPQNIFVWENNPAHMFFCTKIDSLITPIYNLDALIKTMMKFDVIIGNPPYQSDKQNGHGTGSGSSALFVEFIKQASKLIKDDGIINFVTPINVFTGSEAKTKHLLGKDALLSVDYIDLDVNNHFDIGQRVCRWRATALKDNVITKLSDGREVNLKEINYLVEDKNLNDIVNTLISFPGDRLSLSNKGAYNFSIAESYFKKKGVENAKELSREKSKVKDETYPYAVDFNGKISYVRVKPKSYETPRILIPQLTNPDKFRFEPCQNVGANQSTYIVEFESMQEAQEVCDILNNPLYLWIIKNLRIDGRLRKTHLETLPIVNIEKVLSEEQISYIKSNL